MQLPIKMSIFTEEALREIVPEDTNGIAPSSTKKGTLMPQRNLRVIEGGLHSRTQYSEIHVTLTGTLLRVVAGAPPKLLIMGAPPGQMKLLMHNPVKTISQFLTRRGIDYEIVSERPILNHLTDFVAFRVYLEPISTTHQFCMSVEAQKDEAGFDFGSQTIRTLRQRLTEVDIDTFVEESSCSGPHRYTTQQIPVAIRFSGVQLAVVP